MKNASIVLALLLTSSLGFAQEGGMGAPETPAMEAPAAAPAHAKKMSKKQAKAACKSEGKKGKELKECVKAKTM